MLSVGTFISVFKRKDPDPYKQLRIRIQDTKNIRILQIRTRNTTRNGTGTQSYRTLPEQIGTGERLICEVQECLPYLPMACISAVEARLMMLSTAAASSSAALKRESTMQLMASCTDCIRSMKAETTWRLVTFFALHKPKFPNYFHRFRAGTGIQSQVFNEKKYCLKISWNKNTIYVDKILKCIFS